METYLKIAGFLLIVVALAHFIFPRHFNWKKELPSLSLINRQMMYVHTFFIALVVLLMGVLCVYCSGDILHTKLGHQLSFGLFIFWSIRLVFQFFVYSTKNWKGKFLETVMHIIFVLLWGYLSFVFLMICWKY